jgi:hypothetical protein
MPSPGPSWHRPLVGLVGAALVLLGAGCGPGKPKTYPVTGKVVYKGTGEAAKRLAGGHVFFESASDPDKVKAQGEIEEDGTFSLGSILDNTLVDGLLPGEYRARLVPPRDVESQKPIRGLLDPRFESFDKSGLRFTVVAGPNEFTIEVERPRR